LPYDYEYLGNGPRLVITPLTDRVYVTATQALNLKMGCAPAGPAGTGKTETTKDLANALAKLIYVINCSPEMDYKGLGNIFKGVASSGAWVCFDEFNRLVPEVLSVCTVQFKSVCDGIAADATRIRIEGDEINLDPTCGAFITMNPGYLGRSELPEGLKALFRPMTVMVPDLILICENMLMAEGFVTAKALASKFYCLYSLLKALLSAQLHYDWGLRAIKSVLVVAGGFKRAEPDLAEDALLMRALRDFNIPKIVREDEVIFFGLLGDLFPGIDPPRKRDESLESYVNQACEKLGNNPDETFCLKVVQTEELLAIRHCVFIMGPAGSGKSQCWRTLKEARNLRDPDMPTKVVDINPKAVKTEELYGYISMATREWKDGLLSNVMRHLSGIPDEKPKWIVLDGDLDANWIESMNSVMDDNRMLTLASNERIPLLPHMRMIFEIRDLKHATPATVSRAGILYISTDEGTQWRSLVASWIARKGFEIDVAAQFQALFDKYISKTLLWLLINTKSVVEIEDMNRVEVLLNMLDGCVNDDHITNPSGIETVFVYCAVWALGSSLTTADDGTDYRKLFSEYWRDAFKDVKFPSRDTVFDYWLDPGSNTFDSWTKSPFFYSVSFDSSKMSMTQVTVPTPETCSVAYWMDMMVRMRKPVMLAGAAGTGKTQLVAGMLKNFDPSAYTSATINFNFYTTSAVLADTMALPLEKKTGSNFGPPGKTKLVYFVDDLNLPEVDTYNTQSAIAHLRQHMEYEHCYELSKMTLKNISNTQVVSCMNPTAGCFNINPRLQRWFATFAMGLPGSTSLLTIYQTFLDGHLHNFTDAVKEQSTNLIKAALGLHSLVSSTFRKTATNFHYEFNIRHISNVFQGLLVSTPENFQSPDKLTLLWLHESERVYGDRLVSADDLAKFNALAQSQCKKVFPSFPTAKYYAKENAEPLLFCHFAESIEDTTYNQVSSLVTMNKVLEDCLRDYNETNATMDLVLFEDAMKHVARIVRIIRNEGGHALLVGVGGSGKQSLARLAAFICGFSVVQIVISSTYSITDLKDDLKSMFNKAGVKDEGVLFLLTDSQITNERFLIYINDLLASGDIPDLFAVDEVDAIINSVTSRVKDAGIVPERKNCWDYFISRIRKNLHVCLCFSPVGDGFRNRAKKFPALVNCTVIDMFQPWPKDALFSVGKKFLSQVDLGTDKERDVIERFLPFSFEAVNKATIDYKRKERRSVYTTPKSYLELIKLYKILLEESRSDASAAISRLDNGLKKLRDTSESVAKLEADLKIMLEDAALKKDKAEQIAATVTKEKAIAEVETANAQVEKEQVAKIAEEVGIKQRDTEEDLSKAEPAVEAAMEALDTLDQKDLSSCKGMLKPPPNLDEVFAATMVLLAGIMPSVVVQKNGKVKDVSWDAAKKQLMGNIKDYMVYLKEIKTHVDDGSINPQNFKAVREYIEKDWFNVETIRTKNQAAAGLCSFVLNIVQYYDIVTTVEPKRLALAEANKQLAEANQKLEAVMKNVAALEEKLATLTKELEEADASKKEAEDAVAAGERKLNLAQRLTGALGSENERWAENVVALRNNEKLLTGDVLLASAFISYIGPFTKAFREHLMNKVFKPFLQKEFGKIANEMGQDYQIPMSREANPISTLTTPAEIAQWNADYLPADVVSTENACLVCNSSRWPLIIDPQLQGIKWIKERERNLQIVRLGQKDLIRKLEIALENGYTILIENLGESIDAAIMPVIQRATIKRGTKLFLKLGDKEVDFHPEFRLYLHTKLSNPHYPPEIQAETTLINFTVTMDGLEDQLLNLVVEKERPDLAALSSDLITQQNGFKIKVKELEDDILHKLATAEGDITENVALIEGLEATKRISDDIQQKSQLAMKTQAEILEASEKYRSVANRSSLLFFLMTDLVKVHSYYIYSLAAFQQIFFRGIKISGDEAKDNVAARCDVLSQNITLSVFNYIRRGLFEADKLTVAALLTFKILVNDNKIESDEVDFLINPAQDSSSVDPGNMGPLQEWMPVDIWAKIKALESMPRFNGIGDAMQSESDQWQAWFDVEKVEDVVIPGSFSKKLNDLDRLMLLRAIRPDRMVNSLISYVGSAMGQEYVVQKPFSMAQTFAETNNKTPIFFVLFAGVDPTPWVENLGKEKGISTETKRFVNISMGQGQEGLAEATVTKFAKEGGWVMLQNCHLMSSWVPKLERLLEVVSEDAHEDFRCFISAEPPPMASMKNMPESLMQSCIKVANEASSDVQSSLVRAWDNFSPDTFESCSKPNEMKACLFSLCWFHAVVCGRRRFGQQGWSRNYSFNTGDLLICSNVLKSYLDANPVVPWQDLRYIFGEIMYGGHITDAWDRRTCNTYLQVYQREELFSGLELAPGFKSPSPNEMGYNDYIKYAESMPAESPLLFGLHPNAEIGYLTNSSEKLFFELLAMSGGADGGIGEDSAKIVRDVMTNIMSRLPDEFQMVSLSLKAKPLLEGPDGPYIVVALQECARMNTLLSEIRTSISDLDKGLKGQLNMSQAMEDLASAFLINQWPGRNLLSKCMWEKLAWPSQKNLTSQFADMLMRVEQLVKWTENFETPKSIWLPGLFNPSSYLTAAQQVTARKTGLALDKMTIETHVTNMWDPTEVKEYAEDGCYIHGLFLEGARWGEEGTLADSKLKDLLPRMPVIHVKSVPIQPEWEASPVGYLRHDPEVYECPVYLTRMRGPTYVTLATLPSGGKNEKWTLLGSALIMQSD
jgi:dynein heavy chain